MEKEQVINNKKISPRKVINIVVGVLLAIFMVFILLFIIIQLQTKKDINNGLPNAFGVSFLVVDSGSMSTKYTKGLNNREGNTFDYGTGFDVKDIIIVKRMKNADAVEKANLKVGDIVTYYDLIYKDGEWQRAFVSHRIIAIDKESKQVTTRGDQQQWGIYFDPENAASYVDQDATIRYSDIVGVFNGKVLTGWGKAIDFFNSSPGFFVCVVLPLLLFLGYEIFYFSKALKEYQLEKKRSNGTLPPTTKTAEELQLELEALRAKYEGKNQDQSNE